MVNIQGDMMLSYKEGNAGITKVLLEGKIVGEIRPAVSGKYFQYFPKGAKMVVTCSPPLSP
jgi:hypothetical protein